MEALLYNKAGKETGKVSIDEAMFGLRWNGDLVSQVVTSMLSSARENIAHTKGRGDVSGGGKKPWRQKGTGRARHGSSRSPIWVGGGVTHGPTKERNFDRKVNRKMKNKALLTIISKKFKEGEVLFVDDLSFSTPKTKDASGALKALSAIKGFNKLSYKTGKRAFIVTPEYSETTLKSFRNLQSVKFEEVRNLSPLELLNYKYLVFSNPEQALRVLASRTK